MGHHDAMIILGVWWWVNNAARSCLVQVDAVAWYW
jgi:hypothetical protein